MACVCTMDWKDPAVKTFLDVPAPDLAEAKKTASPVTYVSSHAAPLLLLHSRTDPEVPYTLSRRLKKAYRRAGAPVTLVPVDAAHSHAFWNGPRYLPNAMKKTVVFLRSELEGDVSTDPRANGSPRDRPPGAR